VGKLSLADQKRLDRLSKRRGRVKPSKVPARLVRTSAFAPKRRGLITDSAFERLYVVKGHSVVRVSGRELGSQHRDALYAVFRLDAKHLRLPDDKAFSGYSLVMRVTTTWRELLKMMNLTEHVNNVAVLKFTFEEIKKVVMTVYEGQDAKLLEDYRDGRLPQVKGRMGNLLNDIAWGGVGLDDWVQVDYGDWTVNAVMSAKLVSLNADVQFRLTSDYAKSIWPYIDGLTKHHWVDEDRLAELVGRDLWAEHESSATRRDFRASCRKAFDDMVKAGGLKEWREEIRGDGRHKTRRYHYVHGLEPDPQLSLPIGNPLLEPRA
jgi:hypothetical protein